MSTRAAATAPDRWSRPGRRALVVADLATLRGPVTGVAELPHRLVWAPSPAGRFDLDDAYDRIRLYEIVLREAVQPAELQTWLHGSLLIELWPRLYLPRGVRQAWEAVHHRLAAVPVV